MFNFLRRQSHNRSNKEQDGTSEDTKAEDISFAKIRRVRLPQQNSDVYTNENEEELPKVKTEPSYTGYPIRRLELVSEEEEAEVSAELPLKTEQDETIIADPAMPVAIEPESTPFENTLSSIEEILKFTGYYDKAAEEKTDHAENSSDGLLDRIMTEHEEDENKQKDTSADKAKTNHQDADTAGVEESLGTNRTGKHNSGGDRTKNATVNADQDNSDDTTLYRAKSEVDVKPIFTVKMPRAVTFKPGEPLTMEQMAKESSFHLPLPKEMQADNKQVHLTWFKTEFERCRTKEEIEDFAHRLTTNDLSLIFPILATVKNFRDRDRLYAVIEARAGRYLYIHGWTTMQYTYPNSYVQRGLSLLCQTMEENALPFHSVNRVQDAELFSSQDLPQDHFNWAALPLISAVSMPNNRHFISDLVQFAVDHDYSPDRLFQMFGIYTDTPFAEAVLQSFIEVEAEGRGEGTRGLRRFF